MAVLLLAAFAGALWALIVPREPVYHGKALSGWLMDYNRAGTNAESAPASKAIRAIGTNALPFLLSHLSAEDPSRLAKVFFRFVKKVPGLKAPFYGENRFYGPSLVALKVLGKEATPLLPDF
jgi:hypothetical protein